MGSGGYSLQSRSVRAEDLGYTTKSSYEIFKQRSINNAMNPYGVNVRESCDSKEHPNIVPIIIALDVTGSMGSVPHHLVKEGLPEMVSTIIERGIEDPQILFLAIGDHECDRAPLQVGQFESSDELLDKWLTDVWLEGKGGGNGGESYLLAWYFAAKHTSIDSYEKRNKKGFLFTIGDEPTLRNISERQLKEIMGNGEYKDYSDVELLDKAREKYNVFHLHIKETSSGSRSYVINGWKELMGDNLIVIERHQDVAKVIAETVINFSDKIVNSENLNITEKEDNENENEHKTNIIL